MGVAGARTEWPVGEEAAGHTAKDFDVKVIKPVEGNHGKRECLGQVCLTEQSLWLLCKRELE